MERGETLGEMVPVLVVHIKKMEPGEEKTEGDTAKKDKEVGGRQSAHKTAEEEEEEEVGDRQMADKDTQRKTRSMPSVSKVKEQRAKSKRDVERRQQRKAWAK